MTPGTCKGMLIQGEMDPEDVAQLLSTLTRISLRHENRHYELTALTESGTKEEAEAFIQAVADNRPGTLVH